MYFVYASSFVIFNPDRGAEKKGTWLLLRGAPGFISVQSWIPWEDFETIVLLITEWGGAEAYLGGHEASAPPGSVKSMVFRCFLGPNVSPHLSLTNSWIRPWWVRGSFHNHPFINTLYQINTPHQPLMIMNIIINNDNRKGWSKRGLLWKNVSKNYKKYFLKTVLAYISILLSVYNHLPDR